MREETVMAFQRLAATAIICVATGSAFAQPQVQNVGNITAVAPIPLASHPQGQALMAQAVQNTTLIDVNFRFLDKTYENDTYATDPLGNKYKTGCYRFKASSGFRFKVDKPAFTLNEQGLTLRQNIAAIDGTALAATIQVVVCQDIPVSAMGFRLRDVELTYRAKPMLAFNQSNGSCSIGWTQPNLDIKIGDLNILGVQNDVDQLGKKAVQEALNLAFDAYFGSTMRGELVKVTTGICPATGGQTRQPARIEQPVQQTPRQRAR
jgi:hypothetical protein